MTLRKVPKKLLPNFVGLSLLLHVNLALIAFMVMTLNPDGCQRGDLALPSYEVAFVPESDIRHSLDEKDADKLKEKIKEEEKKSEEEEKNPQGQVVEIPKPIEEKRPDKSKYLSEFDSKVDKEKKARPNTTAPKQTASPPPKPAE